MSALHVEGRLSFSFGDDWQILKWDDHTAFQDGLKRFEGTRAVDFVGLLFGAPWFIEVKDFRDYRIENKQRLTSGELAKEIAWKVRDSIASMAWACQRTPLDRNDLGPFLRSLLGCKHKVPVVLWLEEDRPPTPAAASTLAEAIKRELTWLNPKVLVMCRDLAEQHAIPGLVVTSQPAPR
ncbi:hypothetical protein [Polyangium sorediatum]|uniref:Cysteinyl-tRNA synthetase n=1 Tax=Polyangium sorediatum TaxID=889274 RepID=A0ABT6NX94_9BACT|nr:hypothetical protein [Polyangium sorediatum]MDI1432966.1 hypothetical protein [Polyangium sorediatum]